jgi:cell division protein FtsZ
MPKKEEPKKEEKIVMVLGQPEETLPAPKIEVPVTVEVKEETTVVMAKDLSPKLVEDPTDIALPIVEAPHYDITDLREEESAIVHWELKPEPVINDLTEKLLSNSTNEIASENTVGKMSIVGNSESIISTPLPIAIGKNTEVKTIKETDAEMILSIKDSTSTTPVSAASGGYLARPSNIYAESKPEVVTSNTSAERPVPLKDLATQEEEDLLDLQMQIIERDDIPAADMPLAHQAHPEHHREPLSTEVEDPAMLDETEEQKRRAAERLHKLRNLSFNVNAADPNNEFETVPAYIRRNMELYNTNSQVENFYSNYEVKTDQNNQTQISTINTFLDGKKPD